jgi:hypothetical protein
VNLSDGELRWLLYCTAEELRARARGKPPGPQPRLVNLVRRLELEVAVSSTRQEADYETPESEHEVWIGSHLAAQELRWDIRQVQRLASDLEGRKVAGRWIFPESVVQQYAEGLTDDRRAG